MNKSNVKPCPLCHGKGGSPPAAPCYPCGDTGYVRRNG